MKYDPIINLVATEPRNETQMFRGDQILKAPRPELTAASATTFTASSGTGSHVDDSALAVLENMRTRINEIEAALQSLGLLK